MGALNGLQGSIPTNIFDPLQKGVQSSLEGVVKNVFNAIFGGTGPTVQQVNLTLNSQFNLVGSQTSISLITSPTLIIPGTQWDPNTTVGYVPIYNTPLGVFNVSAKPTIKVKKTVTSGSPATIENTSVKYAFTLDKTSFSELFNPALNGIANIQDIKEEVVVFDDLHQLDYPSTPDDPASIYVAGEQETVGTRNAYTNVGNVTFTGMGGNKLFINQLGVRISFRVVPVANPIHSSLIVKTFIANRVNI